MQPISHLLLAWKKSYQVVEKIFFRIFEISIVNAMVVYYYKNPDSQKKKDSNKKFCKILAHELVRPLIDKRAEGDNVLPGPG